MVAGVVEYQDHAPPAPLLAQQPLEKAQEGGGVEDRAHHAYELTGDQTDGTETGNRLSSRGVLQDRVLDFRRYPHATARTVLLEVTFIQTPKFDVGATSQAMEFFLPPQLSADQPERLEGAACGAGNPVVETAADIAELQG